MKFFPILLILGFTLLVFGSVIEIKYALQQRCKYRRTKLRVTFDARFYNNFVICWTRLYSCFFYIFNEKERRK